MEQKNKQKYWYITHIEECVLCGKQKKSRETVYKKPEFSINFEQDACSTHFL